MTPPFRGLRLAYLIPFKEDQKSWLHTLRAVRDAEHGITQCQMIEWHRIRLIAVWPMVKSGLCESIADCLSESKATKENSGPKKDSGF